MIGKRTGFHAGLLAGTAVMVAVLVGGAYWIGRHSLPPSADTYWRNAIATASHGNAILNRTFAGPNGLVGLVVEGTANHSQEIGWGLPGKTAYIVMGQVLDSHGRNLTALAYQAEIGPLPQGGPSPADNPATPVQPPAPSATINALTPAQVWRGVSAATAVVIGMHSPKTSLYVMADANCPYCNDLYKRLMALQPELRKRDINVHWIPVAILSSTSSGRGAALLKGGVAALAENEAGYDSAEEQGGVAPIRNTSLQRYVLANTALLAHDGQPTATPTLVWTDAGGVHVSAGEPESSSLEHILRAMGRYVGEGNGH